MLMGRESSFIQPETHTKEIGDTTKHGEKVLTRMLMGRDMMANGSMILNMEEESKYGLTRADTKETMSKESKMDSDSISGQMVQATKENGKTIPYQATDSTNGQTEGSTLANGFRTIWKAMGLIFGQMAGGMTVNTPTTKKTDTEYMNGLTAESMKAGGQMANNME